MNMDRCYSIQEYYINKRCSSPVLRLSASPDKKNKKKSDKKKLADYSTRRATLDDRCIHRQRRLSSKSVILSPPPLEDYDSSDNSSTGERIKIDNSTDFARFIVYGNETVRFSLKKRLRLSKTVERTPALEIIHDASTRSFILCPRTKPNYRIEKPKKTSDEFKLSSISEASSSCFSETTPETTKCTSISEESSNGIASSEERQLDVLRKLLNFVSTANQHQQALEGNGQRNNSNASASDNDNSESLPFNPKPEPSENASELTLRPILLNYENDLSKQLNCDEKIDSDRSKDFVASNRLLDSCSQSSIYTPIRPPAA